MQTPLVIAHRGDSSRALENSLEAIRLALDLNVDMIEIDIHKSRDNVLYVMHDKDTGRTSDREVAIEHATADELSSVRLRNGEPIPTLNDVLRVVSGKAGLNIEIKSDGAGGLCAGHLIGSAYRGGVLLSSFKEREMLDARRVMPGLATAEIFNEFSSRNVDGYRAKGYTVISLKKSTVTEDLINACHDRRIKVYVWTVNDEEEMRKLIAWGVDGLYTNKPAVLKDVIQKCSAGNGVGGRRL